MLAQLTISNFAIVRELEIDFHSGMTVITGEVVVSVVALKPTWCVPALLALTCAPVFL